MLCLRPVYIFDSFSAGIDFFSVYTLVYGSMEVTGQILTSKVGPRADRVNGKVDQI